MVTGGYFIFHRYRSNPEQIVPYPYTFSSQAESISLDAPILIVGDRMGAYFAKFKAELSAAISVSLAKPIKIQSLAKDGMGLHRTLHQLKSLTQWPQIVIYQGGSEEFREVKFESSEIKSIKKNFKNYSDDRIETALILYPWLSKLVYDPIKRIEFKNSPDFLEEITQSNYLNRLETELLLFEQQLIELANLSKDRNSLLIFTTTPINLDIAPKKVCGFTSNIDIEKEIADLKKLLEEKRHKTAYSMSSKMVKQYSGNAEIFYLHGLASQRLGKSDEAKQSLLNATAFDCEPWRATEVQNAIIRKVAKNNQVLLFDFAKLVENEWNNNVTFFDELHPQNLYYDKGMEQLGLVIKNILKL